MAENVIDLEEKLDGTIAPVLLDTGLTHTVTVKLPGIDRVRLIGMFFDTSKCLLLPSAMKGIRKVKSVYDGHPGGKVLVVGHTDRTGETGYNDALSLERSRAVIAYLTDDVDTWLAFYGAGVPPEKRWGAREDRHMLSALPEGGNPYAKEGQSLNAAVRRFQGDQGLEVDGVAGPKTRRALVTAYMKLDGTTLPAGTKAVAHGCGESFPDVPTADGKEEAQENAKDRRVEIFVFNRVIVPPPGGDISGPDALDYPAWKKLVVNDFDFSEDDEDDVLELRLHDETSKPMADTFYRVVAGGAEPASGKSGGDGFIKLDLPKQVGDHVEIEWGADAADGPFRFARKIFVRVDDGDDAQLDKVRLHNLGYDVEGSLTTAARAFQLDYQVDHEPAPTGLVDGGLPDASRKMLAKIFKELDCDASPAEDAG